MCVAACIPSCHACKLAFDFRVQSDIGTSTAQRGEVADNRGIGINNRQERSSCLTFDQHAKDRVQALRLVQV